MTNTMNTANPLFTPHPQTIENSYAQQFMQFIAQHTAHAPQNFHDLYQFSVAHAPLFWSYFFDFSIKKANRGASSLQGHDFLTARFFQDSRLNYAEICLDEPDTREALVSFRDGHYQVMTRQALYEAVSKIRQFLLDEGISAGDQVAAILPNIAENVIAMLAVASIGARWAAISPQFSHAAILNRLQQISPKLLFAVNDFYQGGERQNYQQDLQQIISQTPSILATVVVDYAGDDTRVEGCDSLAFRSILATYEAAEIDFSRFAFDTPLLVSFSSSASSDARTLLHSAGGVLLQHLKEQQLHMDIKPEQTLLIQTDSGWLSHYWLISALAAKARIVLFDEHYQQGENALFDAVDALQVNHLGVTTAFLEQLHQQEKHLAMTHDLASLKTLMVSGYSVLPQHFAYVYEKIKSDICLASMVTDTDIMASFALGSVLLPVYSGEVQTRALGMAVDTIDDAGHAVFEQLGHLVVRAPFPSMPCALLHDDENRSQYQKRYLHDGVWYQGDYATINAHGGVLMAGRGDNALRRAGVSIAAVEIYQQLATIDAILDAVAIARPTGDNADDEEIILLITLRDDVLLNDDLRLEIKQVIRDGASARHVPAHIFALPDLPRRKNGNIAEGAVKKTLLGLGEVDANALKNPEALLPLVKLAALLE